PIAPFCTLVDCRWVGGRQARERANSDGPMIRRHEEAAPPDRTRRSGCRRRQEGALGLTALAWLASAATLPAGFPGDLRGSRRNHHHTPPPIAAAATTDPAAVVERAVGIGTRSRSRTRRAKALTSHSWSCAARASSR